MVKRKNCHKSSCMNKSSKQYNQKKYKIIRLNGGWSNWSMVLIEYYPCTNKFEASARERYYAELLNSDMNTQVPDAFNSVGYIEYHKRYDKNYQEQHKDKVHARKNAKFTCICSGCYTNANRAKHCKSLKHQKYLDKLNEYCYQWEDGTPCTLQDYINTH